MLVGAGAGQVMVARHYLRRATGAAVVAKFKDDVVELEFGGVRLPKVGATEGSRVFGWIVGREFLPLDWDGVGRAGDDARRERKRVNGPEQTDGQSEFADARAGFFEPGRENVTSA